MEGEKIMFKALCKFTRKHYFLVLIILLYLCAIGSGFIIKYVVGFEFDLNSLDTFFVIGALAFIFLLVSIFLCSLLIHYADAMDYIEQHPWVDKDEAWIKTRPSCWDIDDDYF